MTEPVAAPRRPALYGYILPVLTVVLAAVTLLVVLGVFGKAHEGEWARWFAASWLAFTVGALL